MKTEAASKRDFKASLIVNQKMVDARGNLTTGNLLMAMDMAAHSCARLYAPMEFVTVQIDPIVFKEKVKQNEKLTVLAMINLVGNTSMEVGVKVMSQIFEVDKPRTITTAYFNLVAIDASGKSTPIPQLSAEINSDNKAELARLRKQLRKEYHTKYTELVRLMEY